MSNIEKLGNLLDDRMTERISGNKVDAVCLGTIKGDLSLAVDGLWTVPKGSYMIDRRLALPDMSVTENAEGHSHKFKSGNGLAAGDRVAVVRADNKFIVLAVIKKS